jgi:SAM-dependent methyltransferase
LPDEPALRGSDRLHGTPGRFEVLVCRTCGTGLTLPVVGDHELAAFYPGDYNAYALPESGMLRTAATILFRWRYWRGLRRPPLAALADRPHGRLLDVGGGRGDLGVVLRARGWRVTSMDPSEAACAEARERGIESFCGTLTQPPAELGDRYDAVVFQHSLEHVVDPEADVRAALDRLEHGGLLVVTLPNFGCWQARRFGADWFHLDLPRHRSHFTARGLETLLRRCGATGIELSTSTSADGLPMSLQYRRLERRLEGSARYAAAAASVLAAPVTAALSAVAGGGDLLHALACKPALETGT